MKHLDQLGDAEERYLIFHLGSELYATPLLKVREVVEPIQPKPVPNTAPHFVGVINLRGRIVGLVDLRIRLALPGETTRGVAYLVFEPGV